MTWTIRLNYPRPPKGLHANDRAHWRTKARNTALIREEVFTKIRAAKVPSLDRIRVDVVWQVPNRLRRDTDNCAPFLKAIYDGIGSDRGVSARIVEDDAPDMMQKPAMTIDYIKDIDPGFLVTITDIGGDS